MRTRQAQSCMNRFSLYLLIVCSLRVQGYGWMVLEQWSSMKRTAQAPRSGYWIGYKDRTVYVELPNINQKTPIRKSAKEMADVEIKHPKCSVDNRRHKRTLAGIATFIITIAHVPSWPTSSHLFYLLSLPPKTNHCESNTCSTKCRSELTLCRAHECPLQDPSWS